MKPAGTIRRVSATGRSSGPRCTPAAPAASAMSGRSFTRTGIRSDATSARTRSTCSRGEASLSRSCTAVAPPRSAARASATRSRPSTRRSSVTSISRTVAATLSAMTLTVPRLQGIRGATTVERNDAAEILGATDELLRTLIESNELQPDDIVSALFTVTRDLDAAFPAQAAEDFGWNIVALLHASEIPVPGSLPKCIRLLVHAYTARSRAEIKHCYLRGATALRPDRA